MNGATVDTQQKAKHYKELLVWQKGMSLAKAVYVLTAQFPADERFGLVSQMRRAAVSVPSNVAEGQAREVRANSCCFCLMRAAHSPN